jgi:thioredoxin-dependent peroxiredoxin
MNKVSIGMKAPDFTLPSIDGRSISLSQKRGNKVLISLLRNARCAICNLWVANAIKLAPAWEQSGLQILAVFESSTEKLKEQFKGRAPGFPVLADSDGAVHEVFGSYNDPSRVNEVVSKGLADEAMKRAAANGFAPTMEDGANFFRIPSEVLVDEDGIVRAVHHADQIFNHMDLEIVRRFLG